MSAEPTEPCLHPLLNQFVRVTYLDKKGRECVGRGVLEEGRKGDPTFRVAEAVPIPDGKTGFKVHKFDSWIDCVLDR